MRGCNPGRVGRIGRSASAQRRRRFGQVSEHGKGVRAAGNIFARRLIGHRSVVGRSRSPEHCWGKLPGFRRIPSGARRLAQENGRGTAVAPGPPSPTWGDAWLVPQRARLFSFSGISAVSPQSAATMSGLTRPTGAGPRLLKGSMVHTSYQGDAPTANIPGLALSEGLMMLPRPSTAELQLVVHCPTVTPSSAIVPTQPACPWAAVPASTAINIASSDIEDGQSPMGSHDRSCYSWSLRANSARNSRISASALSRACCSARRPSRSDWMLGMGLSVSGSIQSSCPCSQRMSSPRAWL